MPDKAPGPEAMIALVNKYVVTTTNMLNATAAETEKRLSDLDYVYVTNHGC